MPRAKITTSPIKKTRTTRRISKDENKDLMDFEDFIAQKPQVVAGRGKGIFFGIFLVLIIILGAALYFLPQRIEQTQTELKYKAIYLDAGQIYYAKVVKEDEFSIYLDDVYYVQTEQRTLPPAEEGGEEQIIDVPILVSRGNEIHKPTGLLQINRQKLIAIEEIGDDSEIILEINRQKEEK